MPGLLFFFWQNYDKNILENLEKIQTQKLTGEIVQYQEPSTKVLRTNIKEITNDRTLW